MKIYLFQKISGITNLGPQIVWSNKCWGLKGGPRGEVQKGGFEGEGVKKVGVQGGSKGWGFREGGGLKQGLVGGGVYRGNGGRE